MLKNIKLLSLSALILALVLLAPNSANAQEATAAFFADNITTGTNNTQAQSGWSDPVSARPGDAVEFRIVALNTVPNSTARNVRIFGDLSAPRSSTLGMRGYVASDNAGTVSDLVTVNVTDGSSQQFNYIPGHATIFSTACPSGCSASDTVYNNGVNVGDLAYNESVQVTFKAYVSNIVAASPSPATTSPSPAATSPSPAAAASPSPSAGVGGTTINNNNNNTNNNSNTNNVTVNAAAAPAAQAATPKVVAAAPVQTRELPKTGLPAMALPLLGLLPAGWKLRKFGKGGIEQESENPLSIWMDRQSNLD